MQSTKTRADLWMDLLLVAFLIGFDVAARLLPHAPGVWPFAASALFAGRMLRIPALAVIVPLAAVLLSNVALAGDDWRITLVVCARYHPTGICGHAGAPLAGRNSGDCGDAIVFADFLCDHEFCGMGFQRHVSAHLARPRAVLCRGAPVPGQDRTRRPVLDRGTVRRRLAGAARADPFTARALAEISLNPIPLGS